MAGSDFSTLQAEIDKITAQVTKTETTEESAGVLIAGFSASVTKAVTDALTADDAADAGSIKAATTAIATVTSRFVAADDKLGAAVVANTPPVVTPPAGGGGTPPAGGGGAGTPPVV